MNYCIRGLGCYTRPHQDEVLLEAINFPNKEVEHLLVLVKGNPTLSFASLHPSMYSEEGKKYIFGGSDLEVLANKLEHLHKGIRFRVQLRWGQLRPLEHAPPKVGERKSKPHVFKNDLVHGKLILPMLRANAVRITR